MQVTLKRNEPATGGLANAVARGGIVTAASTWTRFVLQFGTVILVARLLGPVEYGFAAIVLVFSSISELLRGSGLASAVLQRSDLTPAIASRVHYISSAVGLSLAAMMLAAGPVIGQMINDDRVGGFSPILAGVLACAGISAVPTAMLARDLRFHLLAAIDFGAVLLGCAVAISLALTGFGAASLVWQAAVIAVVTMLAVLLLGSWRPGRPAGRAAARPYVSFGMNAAVTQIVRYIAQNVDRVLLGVAGNAAGVGLYAQAMQLIQLPVAQLSAPLQRVIIPALSRLLEEPLRYRSYFRSVLQLFALLLWPVLVGVAALAPDLIQLVFGDAWVGSAPLMQLLLGTGLAAPVVFAASWVFVSTGNARSQSLLMVGVAGVTVTAVVFALPHGAAAVALAVSAASLLSTFPAMWLARARSPLQWRDLLTPLLWPTTLALLVGITVLGITPFATDPLTRLALGIGSAVAVTGVACALIAPIRRSITELVTLLRARTAPTSEKAVTT